MEENKYSQALKDALQLLRQKQEQIDALIQAKPQPKEPIAIIGIACRFAGGANNPELLWQLFNHNQDASIEIPPSRWPHAEYYHPQPGTPGKTYTKNACLLDTNVFDFDAGFFGMSELEADYLDPQQRLLLEVAWEALEAAAIPINTLRESNTDIFFGLTAHDYSDVFMKLLPTEDLSAYAGIGNAASAAAGRLANLLGTRGAAIAVDTACSSSITATHLACNSLHNHQCDLALSGAVTLMLAPTLLINFGQAGLLSPTGHCRSFDAKADGYVRGEGCGVLVLKRLADAKRDKNPILALIRGSAVNNNGMNSNIIAPNGPSQIRLIQQALADAELTPSDIDYIEAHGSGSPLGDVIEFNALKKVFAEAKRSKPLIISSSKNYLGYTEAAGGVAGIIKTVLSLQQELIPKHLHFTAINPEIKLAEIPAQLPVEALPWVKSDRPRRAGVSAFGFSGSNAHLILEEAPAVASAVEQKPADGIYRLVISAKSKNSLALLVRAYIDFLQISSSSLADICYTSQVGRTHFDQRVGVSGSDKEELLKKLQQWPQNPAETDPIVQSYLNKETINWDGGKTKNEGGFKKVILPNYCFDRQLYIPENLKLRLEAIGIIFSKPNKKTQPK